MRWTRTDNHSYGNAILTFDPKAEARLRWKIDLYIIPTVALLYLFCFIDRANIGNARLAGLEKDLKLKGYDYNMVLSIFYISYIIFEVSTPAAVEGLLGCSKGWVQHVLPESFKRSEATFCDQGNSL